MNYFTRVILPFLRYVLPLLRDSAIGKIFDWVIELVKKCIFRNTDNRRNGKYGHCKSHKQLFASAISDIANITKTDYNQIILCVNRGTHELSLLVCADKIVKGKPKYRIAAIAG